MKRCYVVVLISSITLFAGLAEAKKKSILRGGFGLLYPDHNLFTNPGQNARKMGTSLEILYSRQDVSGSSIQTLKPSVSFAKGGLALGVAASRSGSSFDSTASDSVDAGLGLGLGKSRRVTLGARYERGIDVGQNSDGFLTGAITLNPPKGKGFSVGAAYKTTVNAVTNAHGASLALGYAGKNPNNNFEIVAELPNLDATDNYIGSLFFSLASKKVYFGMGYNYVKLASASAQHIAKGRLGVLLGKKTMWDLSAFAEHIFQDGQNPAYGLTLRATF